MFLQSADILGTVVWFFLFFILIFLYPRLMLSQLIYKLEQSAQRLEKMSEHVNTMSAKKASGSGQKETKKQIDEFTDFFVVEPSNIDPYGLVKKIDNTIRSMETRFTEFSDEIGTGLSKEQKQELNYTLRAAIGVRQLSKIVRHFVEISKKFRNLQIAMILQMQMPIIEKIAEGEMKGAEAFAKGWPIGDSIGPLVAASMMEKSRPVSEDVVVGIESIKGRKCFILKATGPSPHLGRVDEAINSIMKKNKISRIITIDAAGKLEGEKSGSVAEGIGFAMGGIGQREMIENVLLPKGMQIDSVVVKVGMTEAITPMKKDIYKSVPKVISFVEKAVQRSPKGSKVIIIGVGNSSGIGDSRNSLKNLEKLIEEFDKKYKEEEEKTKKGRWF